MDTHTICLLRGVRPRFFSILLLMTIKLQHQLKLISFFLKCTYCIWYVFYAVLKAAERYRGDGKAKRAEPFVFALIFFVSFLYQDKKEKYNY
jgi:hypothetical protein